MCSRIWLSPNLNLVSNFIPTWSWNYLPGWDYLPWNYLPFYTVEITYHEITYLFTLLPHTRLLRSGFAIYCQSTTCTTCFGKFFLFLLNQPKILALWSQLDNLYSLCGYPTNKVIKSASLIGVNLILTVSL